jgi:hypothetical protein
MNQNLRKIMNGHEFKQKFPNYKPVKFVGNNWNNF